MRQCRYCGGLYDNLQCPDCARKHDDMRKTTVVGSLGRKAISLTLDQIEGNSEEADGGTLFPVKDFRA